MATVSFQIGQDQQLTLESTGPNTARLTEAGTSYELGNVTYAHGVLNASVLGYFGVRPHIMASFVVGRKEDDVKIAITKAYLKNGESDYPVSLDDMKRLQAFLAEANFPAA